MSNLVNTNAIVPEVYSELVREKITGNMIVGQFLKTNGTLTGNVGETVTLPKWAYIGDAEDIAVGTAMNPSAMEQTSTTATIKMVGAPAVRVFDYDNKTAIGDAINEGATQQGKSIARKIDKDAIDCACTTLLKKKLATEDTLTSGDVLSALALYGDERNASDFTRGGIVLHSAFAQSLYSLPLFVSREQTTSKDGNGITENNCIGEILGIKVYLSDRLYDATNQEPFGLIIKNDSISWIPKEAPFSEQQRNASLRATDIFTSEFYAMALTRDDGVVLLKKTLPTA